MNILREPFRLRVSDLPGIEEQRGAKLDSQPSGSAKLKRFAKAPRVEPVDARTFLMKKGYAFPKTAKTISVLMCKGGVGKTSTSYFVALRMSMYGARVLIIDADPQGNLTGAFRLDELHCELDEDSAVLLDVLEETCKLKEALIAVTPNLHLLPSTPMNSVLDARIRDKFKNPALPIRRLLESVKDDYDFILIDCAPALNLTNTAIIGASHAVVLPVGPDLFSFMGLKQTLKELGQIESDFDLKLEKKVVMTKFDARETTSRSYLAKLESEFADHLCQTRIRSSSDIRNAVHQGQDLFDLNQSHGKADYDQLTLELMGATPFVAVETAGQAAIEAGVFSMTMKVTRKGAKRPWQEDDLGREENLSDVKPTAAIPPLPDYDKELPHLRKIAQFLAGFGKTYNRFESHGTKNIPKEGAALIVFYHALIPLDAWYFGMQYFLKSGRLIHALGDRWLFKVPGMKQLAEAVGIVEASPKNAKQLLQEGRLVAVAPGGVREAVAGSEKQYELQWDHRNGFAELVKCTGVTVVPAFSENSEQMYLSPLSTHPIFQMLYQKTRLPLVPILGLGPLPLPVKVTTWIGEPLQFDPEDSVETIRTRTQEALQALIEKHQTKNISLKSALLD